MASSDTRGSNSAAVGSAVRFFKELTARVAGSRKTFTGHVPHPIDSTASTNTSALALRTTQLICLIYQSPGNRFELIHRFGVISSPARRLRMKGALMTMKLTRAGILVLLLIAATAHADEKFPKCFNAARQGHCSAIQVNGQRSVRLTKATKKILEPLAGLKFGQFETRYEVP